MAALRNLLISKGFKVHNNKSEELVASKFHSSMKSTRIVAHTGVCKKTGKHLTVNAHTHFKAVFVNRQGHWRTIATGSAFAQRDWKQIDMIIKAIEHLATKAPTCKHCKAPKFKAKSGNVVCSNACWTGWSKGKPKKAAPKKAAPKKVAAKKTAPKKPRATRKVGTTAHAPRRPNRSTREQALDRMGPLVVEQFHVGQLVKLLPQLLPDAGPPMGVVVSVEEHGTVTRVEGPEQQAQFLTVRMMDGDTRKSWNYRSQDQTSSRTAALYFTAAS